MKLPKIYPHKITKKKKAPKIKMPKQIYKEEKK